ncbi:hypothetical protein RFI_02500 [Reticulomyxa filosa]|uniref:Uncharacterized protein n=1 Tax=Reticulomyxa filosa TaxID=46433 RepID=X6P947_RETFI|nr:hypothetical protein RFI_02500 [Reticulomyxa filosa]|eukprot:ETO34589.1 hypothetical protein RFI_02500 [Reticulomyxa filosa]
MFAQLQQNFPKIDKEVILKAWNWFEKINETMAVLTLLTENTTTLEQQENLLVLLKQFNTKVEKGKITQIWKSCNQFYFNTLVKLREICLINPVNELHEDGDLKILREMCLHILWNILKYPTNIKYRQINYQNLYDNLQSKCYQLGKDVNQIFVIMEHNLQRFGFEKRNDKNWYYPKNDIQLLWLWQCYREWINQQIIYKERFVFPGTICMFTNGKWINYDEVVFDYQHRTIMLLNINEDKDKLKIKILQVGNPKKNSLEFNVHIQWYNDFNDTNITHAKWACLTFNHTWHFRTIDNFDRRYLSNCCVDFNSFSVISEYQTQFYKESLNPYCISLKQGTQRLKDKFQIAKHFQNGTDELVYCKCEFEEFYPLIVNISNENVILYDIYKHFSHFPIIQVYWKIDARFIVSYKHTVTIERTKLSEDDDLGIESYLSKQNPKFNPLLYECDIHKLKAINDKLWSNKIRNSPLKHLLHEIIKNDYLRDLITITRRHIHSKKNFMKISNNKFITVKKSK